HNHGDQRSEDELRATAAKLLKGCCQHFESQVTRVLKISAIVHPSQKEHFCDCVLSLCNGNTMEDFTHITDALLRDYPQMEKWLRWWMREEHARMLFESFRQMDEHIWHFVPGTTNAQEAMHYVLYAAVGKGHRLLEGLLYLHAFAVGFQRLSAARSVGVKICYGESQRWKRVAQNIGRTKPERAPEARTRKRSTNDGRGPDTAKELLKEPNVPSKALAKSGLRPSYPWENNSCWLDCSLELIYTTVSTMFYADFHPRFPQGDNSYSIQKLLTAMDFRMTLVDLKQASAMLRDQWNSLRQELKRAGIITDLSDMDSLFMSNCTVCYASLPCPLYLHSGMVVIAAQTPAESPHCGQ
ncbi:hypothetical protein BDN67DRAFT_986171, partial [Paxillus ammoniavirescens]